MATDQEIEYELDELYDDIFLELSDIASKLERLKTLARYLAIDEKVIATCNKRTILDHIKTAIVNKRNYGGKNKEENLRFLKEFYKKIYTLCTPGNSNESTPNYYPYNEGLQLQELSEKLIELKFQMESKTDSPQGRRSDELWWM